MKLKSADAAVPVAAPKAAPAAKPQAAVESNAWQARAQSKPVAPPAAPLSDSTVKKAVTSLATAAVSEAIIRPSEEPAKHPLLARFGRDLGLALGVLVTEALALVPSWNAPVLDSNGKPVQSVEGAERIGDRNILKRHQEYVGPKIEALVDKMQPSALRDLLDGFAEGASAAPGVSYRLEAGIADHLDWK